MRFKLALSAAVAAAALAIAAPVAAQTAKPTIVLVHGAFADSSSWNGVVADLERDGYPVVAAANPLRGIASDATYVAALVKATKGKVILVGHSYGGAVIAQAAASTDNVAGLVFVSAFSPDVGETLNGLGAKFPGAALGSALTTSPLPDGGVDLYVKQDLFGKVFAPDVPAAGAKLAAAEQRPIAAAAFDEKQGAAAWKTVPSWHIYGSKDQAIAPAALAFMADRAHSRKTVVVPGGSHVTLISHADDVAALIEAAATGS
jgi:pimeloyl-ACP methyl ester carboxylesterase